MDMIEQRKRAFTGLGISILVLGTVMLILDSITVSIVVQNNLISEYTRIASGIWGGLSYMISGIVATKTGRNLMQFKQYIFMSVYTIIAMLVGIPVLILQSLAAADCAPNSTGAYFKCNQSVSALHITTATLSGIALILESVLAWQAWSAFAKFKDVLSLAI